MLSATMPELVCVNVLIDVTLTSELSILHPNNHHTSISSMLICQEMIHKRPLDLIVFPLLLLVIHKASSVSSCHCYFVSIILIAGTT